MKRFQIKCSVFCVSKSASTKCSAPFMPRRPRAIAEGNVGWQQHAGVPLHDVRRCGVPRPHARVKLPAHVDLRSVIMRHPHGPVSQATKKLISNCRLIACNGMTHSALQTGAHCPQVL